MCPGIAVAGVRYGHGVTLDRALLGDAAESALLLRSTECGDPAVVCSEAEPLKGALAPFGGDRVRKFLKREASGLEASHDCYRGKGRSIAGEPGARGRVMAPLPVRKTRAFRRSSESPRGPCLMRGRCPSTASRSGCLILLRHKMAQAVENACIFLGWERP